MAKGGGLEPLQPPLWLRLWVRKTTLAEYIFIPRHIWFFHVVHLRQEVLELTVCWSILQGKN